jgi:hypothetical protein
MPAADNARERHLTPGKFCVAIGCGVVTPWEAGPIQQRHASRHALRILATQVANVDSITSSAKFSFQFLSALIRGGFAFP